MDYKQTQVRSFKILKKSDEYFRAQGILIDGLHQEYEIENVLIQKYL